MDSPFESKGYMDLIAYWEKLRIQQEKSRKGLNPNAKTFIPAPPTPCTPADHSISVDDLTDELKNFQIGEEKSNFTENQNISVDDLTDKLNNLQIGEKTCQEIKKNCKKCENKSIEFATNGKYYCGYHIKKYVSSNGIGKMYCMFGVKDKKILCLYIGETIRSSIQIRFEQHAKSKKKRFEDMGIDKICMILLEKGIASKLKSRETSWIKKYKKMGYKNFFNEIIEPKIKKKEKVYTYNYKTSEHNEEILNCEEYLYDSSYEKNTHDEKYKLMNKQKA
jgi:hypothetical protein|tara:strand:- start:14434 stop:15267 length:834 start_codon:yes stop_codon:yes gene_type:complete